MVDRERVYIEIGGLDTVQAGPAPRRADTNTGSPSVTEIHGHGVSEYDMAMQFYVGYDVPQDYEQARTWLQKSAEQGYAKAQSVLSSFYALGIGGAAQDYEQAVIWDLRAAKQGHAIAQLDLGNMYFGGIGVAQDFARARKWFERAAEQGCDRAQFNLAKIYRNGHGVRQDYAVAKKWVELAFASGHEPASEPCRTLAKKFIFEQDTEGRENMREELSANVISMPLVPRTIPAPRTVMRSFKAPGSLSQMTQAG